MREHGRPSGCEQCARGDWGPGMDNGGVAEGKVRGVTLPSALCVSGDLSPYRCLYITIYILIYAVD